MRVSICFLFPQVHFNMALCVSRLAHNMAGKWVCVNVREMHRTHRIGNNMKIKRLCWKWMRALEYQHASNIIFHFIHFCLILFICFSSSSVNLLYLSLCLSLSLFFVNFNLNLVHFIRLYRNRLYLHAIEWRWLILKELMMIVKRKKYTDSFVWVRKGRRVKRESFLQMSQNKMNFVTQTR